MKPKYDIYIRTDLRERFDKEPNKSGLVNELLAAHYSGKPVNDTQVKPTAPFKEIVKETSRKDDYKLCPHGYPANGWSCRKGCK